MLEVHGQAVPLALVQGVSDSGEETGRVGASTVNGGGGTVSPRAAHCGRYWAEPAVSGRPVTALP